MFVVTEKSVAQLRFVASDRFRSEFLDMPENSPFQVSKTGVEMASGQASRREGQGHGGEGVQEDRPGLRNSL